MISKLNLTQFGRNPRLEAWQFAQNVNALRILYCDLLKPDWAGSFDWQYWIDSAQELESCHPTLAREQNPISLSDSDDTPLAGIVSAVKKQAINKLREKLRSKNYTIRTETTYVTWVLRFLRFDEGQDVSALSDKEVKYFLNHLAVDQSVSASTQQIVISAVVFFFNQVLTKKTNDFGEFIRA